METNFLNLLSKGPKFANHCSRSLCEKMDMIKDKNSRDPTEAEHIKKRWQEYIEEVYQKDLDVPDNTDSAVADFEPDILESKVGLRKHG